MVSFEAPHMLIKSYQSQVELLLRNYVSADPFIVYSSILVGIFACKTVYELSQLISSLYFKSYLNLTSSQQIEWSNRAISTSHSVYIATVSLYFMFWSDLYSDNVLRGPITVRSSTFSTFALGVSVGYFLSDLAMIIWYYPSLGEMEYVIHHVLSLLGVTYAMLTGKAQIYAYMVLMSEATTPWINLRWYLDASGLKRSKAYIINGIVIFLSWLVARIMLFVYLFYHAYVYYDQVNKIRGIGVSLVLIIPAGLSVMNLIWFWKIFKGLKKTLGKKRD